jgi:hypothetical protein
MAAERGLSGRDDNEKAAFGGWHRRKQPYRTVPPGRFTSIASLKDHHNPTPSSKAQWDYPGVMPECMDQKRTRFPSGLRDFGLSLQIPHNVNFSELFFFLKKRPDHFLHTERTDAACRRENRNKP